MSKNNPFLWKTQGETNVGKVRALNEDALIVRDDISLWVVADGMGGHAAGDVASTMIVDAIGKLEPPETLSKFVDTIEDALIKVNRDLLTYSREQHQSQTVGSTVVGMVGYGNLSLFFWVGDSRLYLLRGDEFTQLTRDHTYVEELVSQGLLLREEAAHHPEKNTITRGVGARMELCVDFDYCEVKEGDIYLLCSDGLEKEMVDNEVKNVLLESNIAGSVAKLIQITVERGARDNVTIIAIEAVNNPDYKVG
ncbi:Protein serine/threonine phosphatase PrpC, regulation of stationary phase [hydrothermal vent metagenome]|uniref:Protein serine/threonine phosphatase PrpC, regulation of stationary phase n=1 Tax=hydrothermal vent metagenome TaxID=652676 RepID=A0A3B1B3D4_9ZZZZ